MALLLFDVHLTTNGGETRADAERSNMPKVGDTVDVTLPDGDFRPAVVESVLPGHGEYAAVLMARLIDTLK